MQLIAGGLAAFQPDDDPTRAPPEPATDLVLIEATDDPEAHDANLAEAMTSSERDELADELLTLVERDARAREKWDRLAKRGQRMMGLAVEDIQRERAVDDRRDADDVDDYWTHTAVHPLLAEAIVRFQAQASAELFPPEGPAKGFVVPEDKTTELEAQAGRVSRLINWLTTDELPEYGDQTDRLLFLVALEGVVYTKVTYDPDRFVRRLLVRSHDVWLPWHATTFSEATRVTHRMRWHPSRIKRLQKSGYLLPEDLSGRSPDERTDAEREADKSVGLEPEDSRDEDDAPLEVLEVYAEYQLAGPGLPDEDAPYVFTIARADRKLLAIRRNWRPSSPERRRRWDLLTQWPFVLGDHPGPYAYGLPHLIGSLSETATVILRATLDIAAKQASPPGFIQSTLLNHPDFDKRPLNPGELRATPTTVDDLKRALFFLTPGDASALNNVLQFIVDAGQRFASTADLQVGAGDNRAPVGTTLAMIEQGSRVYSSIHARLHRAQRRELRTINDLIGEYTPPEQPYPWPIKGQIVPLKPDFDGRVDVVPVSDPHVSSNSFRLATAQALVQLAAQAPDLFDRYEVGMRMLVALRAADPERLLIRPDQAERRDAISENMCFLLNRPVRAYFDQDHAAHLAVHQQWFQTLPPEGQSQLMPAFMAHLGEHLAYQYRTQIEATIGQLTQAPPGALLPPPPPMKDDKDAPPPPLAPEQERAIDAIAAQAAQVMAQNAPPPADPEQQKQQLEAQKLEQQAQQAQADMQLRSAIETRKAEQEQQRQQADVQIRSAVEARKAELEQQKMQAEQQLQRERLAQEAQLARERMALEAQQFQVRAQAEERKAAQQTTFEREKFDREHQARQESEQQQGANDNERVTQIGEAIAKAIVKALNAKSV